MSDSNLVAYVHQAKQRGGQAVAGVWNLLALQHHVTTFQLAVTAEGGRGQDQGLVEAIGGSVGKFSAWRLELRAKGGRDVRTMCERPLLFSLCVPQHKSRST